MIADWQLIAAFIITWIFVFISLWDTYRAYWDIRELENRIDKLERGSNKNE